MTIAGSVASFAVEQGSPPRSARQTEVFERLIDLTLERGFARYTLEEAAIVLRCSKSTIYALAGTREQLIRAVVVAFFRRAAERVEQRVAAESDRLAIVVRSHPEGAAIVRTGVTAPVHVS